MKIKSCRILAERQSPLQRGVASRPGGDMKLPQQEMSPVQQSQKIYIPLITQTYQSRCHININLQLICNILYDHDSHMT